MVQNNGTPPDGKKINTGYDNLIRKEGIYIVIASTLLGLLYALLTDSFDSLTPFANGTVIGFLCGIGIAWSELFLFRNASRKLGFMALVIGKVFIIVGIVTVTIFTVILCSRSLTSGQSPWQTFRSEAFMHFLAEEDFIFMIVYAFVMALVVIFTKQMSRKMGQGVLFDFITGRYAKPFHEDRIFLFLDLDSSSGLAEQLGDLAYHRLLNDFFCDIAKPIVASRGAIHHYVGDEVVISWPMKKGLEKGNCLNAYFAIVDRMALLGDRYRNAFGVVPTFKAAYHCGSIVVGEVGDVKSEIVFHGDVINTTSRIERLCSALNERILVSRDLLERLPSFRSYFRFVGNFALRGKKARTDVYGFLKKEEPIAHLHDVIPEEFF